MANRVSSVAAPANQIKGISQALRSIRRDEVCGGIGRLTDAVSSVASSTIGELSNGSATAAVAGRWKRNQSGVTAVQRGSIGVAADATNMATMVVENTSRRRSADLFLSIRLMQSAAPSAMPDFQNTANKTGRNSNGVVIDPPFRAGQSAPTVDLFPEQTAPPRTSPEVPLRQLWANPRKMWIRAAAEPTAAPLPERSRECRRSASRPACGGRVPSPPAGSAFRERRNRRAWPAIPPGPPLR